MIYSIFDHAFIGVFWYKHQTNKNGNDDAYVN